MIRTFRHKGLKALYEKNQTKGLNPQWLKRIRAILARLDAVPGIRTVQASVTDPGALRPLLERADLVVGAVPGQLGFETL